MLWVVTSSGAIRDEEPDIQDLGGSFIAAHRADGCVEMLVEGGEAMIGRLSRLPEVLAVALAQDGCFADDADGTIVIAEGGTRWQRLPAEEVRPGQACRSRADGNGK